MCTAVDSDATFDSDQIFLMDFIAEIGQEIGFLNIYRLVQRLYPVVQTIKRN